MTICKVRGIGKLRKTSFHIRALKVTENYVTTRAVYGMGIGRSSDDIIRWDDFIVETPDGIYEITPLTKEQASALPKETVIAGV